MFAAHEISQAVRTRRLEIGLSQKAVARLAGLSRATIGQVEGGTIKDLSLTRTATFLDVLGLGLMITPAPQHENRFPRP
jgi:transcriptional regulator with XRE-family HTH domain